MNKTIFQTQKSSPTKTPKQEFVGGRCAKLSKDNFKHFGPSFSERKAQGKEW